MEYQHKIIRNHPSETIGKFEDSIPYLPHKGEKIVFPENWKAGEWFTITNIEHYVLDKLIVIRVN